jgi:hypothetical protein
VGRLVTAGPTRTGARDPLRVEHAEAERDEQPRDDPEPDDDGDLAPAFQLEVVLQRRHPEHPPSGDLEEADLHEDRQRDEHEQPTEQHQQQLGASGHGQPGECPAERERAGVAHEDLGRRRVPPQESEAGTHHRGGHDRQVERVTHLVAARDRHVGPRTVLAVLPGADQHVRREDHHRGAGGQSVEPVGEVHGVGGPCDHDVGPHHEEDRAQAEAGVADERHVGRRGRVTVGMVREPDGEDRERHRHHQLADQLGVGPQAEAALHDHLDVVVDEAHQAHAGHQHEHQQSGHGERAQRDQVGPRVADQRAQDDHGAAHRGGAALGVVGGRAVITDQLAVPVADQQPDGDRSAEQRDDQAER